MFWSKKLSPIVGDENSPENDDLKAPKMVVGREFLYNTSDGFSEKAVEFCVLDNYVEFYKLIQESEEKHFYEIIYGNQKPHFDIDLEVSRILDPEHENPLWESMSEDDRQLLMTNRSAFVSRVLLKKICQAIYDMFSKMYPVAFDAEKQFVITDSSTPDKLSFHIVLDGIFHRSCQESKVLYDAVVAHIALTDSSFDTRVIDPAVYKRNQQFRTLWSSKTGKSNAKKYFHGEPIEILSKDQTVLKLGTKAFLQDYEGEDVSIPLEVFARSLVSNTIACSGLRTARVGTALTAPTKSKKNSAVIPRLPDETSKAAWDLFSRTELSRTDGKVMFKVRQVNSNRIILQKLGGYHCPVCDRKHDAENPYLTVTDDMMVFYNCRRAMDNKERQVSMVVGSLLQK